MSNLTKKIGLFTLVNALILHSFNLPAISQDQAQEQARKAEVLAKLQAMQIDNLPDFDEPLTIDFTGGGKDQGLAMRTFGVSGVQGVKSPKDMPTGIWTMLNVPQSSSIDLAKMRSGDKGVKDLENTPLKDSHFADVTIGEFAKAYPETGATCNSVPLFQGLCGNGRAGSTTIQGLQWSPSANKKLSELPSSSEAKLKDLQKGLDVPLNKFPSVLKLPVSKVPFADKVPFSNLLKSKLSLGGSGISPIAWIDTTLSGEAIEKDRIKNPGSDPPGENPCSGKSCDVVELKGVSFDGQQVPDSKHKVSQGSGWFKGMGPPGFDIDGHDGTMLMGFCGTNAQTGSTNVCISFRPSPFYFFGRHAFPYFIGPFPLYPAKDKNKGGDIIVTALSGLSSLANVASPAASPSASPSGVPVSASTTQAVSNALPTATNPANLVQNVGNKIELGKYSLDINNPLVQKEILGAGGKELLDQVKSGNLKVGDLVDKFFPLEAQERVRNELIAKAIKQAKEELGSDATEEQLVTRAKNIYLGEENSPVVSGIDLTKLAAAYLDVVGMQEPTSIEKRVCADICVYLLGKFGQSSSDPVLRDELLKRGGSAFLSRLDKGESVDPKELANYLDPNTQKNLFLRSLSALVKQVDSNLSRNTGTASKDRILTQVIQSLYAGENASGAAFSPLNGKSQDSVIKEVITLYN